MVPTLKLTGRASGATLIGQRTCKLLNCATNIASANQMFSSCTPLPICSHALDQNVIMDHATQNYMIHEFRLEKTASAALRRYSSSVADLFRFAYIKSIFQNFKVCLRTASKKAGYLLTWKKSFLFVQDKIGISFVASLLFYVMVPYQDALY